MKFSPFIIIIILTVFNSSVSAQNKEEDLYFYIDLPLFEYPYNSNSQYSTASMEQATKLTKSFYYSTHYCIEKFGQKKLGKRGAFWSKVIMTVFDFAPVPLSNTWLHEEAHCCILSLHNINNRNSHWSNSVKLVDDEDLILLKLRHPADMVREATAGNENNLEFVSALQKDVFFNRVNTWNYGLYWGNYLVNSFYLWGSTRPGSKPLVKFKHRENSDIHKRDVNGFDPINATYDLFNPHLSYEARGIHPSGVGIDRYVEFDDLSIDAQNFLKTQFRLSLLNFVDPNLLGMDEFGKNIKYNISLRHHMTSFGYMVGGNFFFKTKRFGGIVSPKLYKNKHHHTIGLDVEFNNKWGAIRLAGWQQPKHQMYEDTEKKAGGLVGIRIAPLSKKISPYLEMTLKSAGWVAGNPYLTNNFSMGLGISWRIGNNPFF